MTNSTIAALCLLAAFTGQAWAAAARVDFAYGNVTVAGPDGAERPLVRGAELDNDHVVRTAEGRAQLRFADGAYVSLQPRSEFAIRDYRFNGKTDGAERGFFALTKGAMRTVTGLIGRVNRDRYKVDTPTATIGIRGTGGVIQILEDGSTLVVGTSGIWSLSNAAGSVDVPAGVSALAPATPLTAPQPSSQAPQAGPASLPSTMVFTQGEQRSPSALAAALAEGIGLEPLASGSGYAAALAFTAAPSRFLQPFQLAETSATASFDSSGRLQELTYGDGQTYKLDPASGAHAEFGSDGVLAWGRWTGKVVGQYACGSTVCPLDQQYAPNEGLHYVVGLPTAVLPVSGSANYTLLGATRPTSLGGGTEPGTFNGSLSVSFGAVATIAGTFSAAMPGSLYAWSASGATSSASFSLATTSSSGCAGTCAVSTQGFFAGSAAERVGLSYQIQDAGSAVIGAAAFGKQ